MEENISFIPARLKNAAKNGYVTGAADIFDDIQRLNLSLINQNRLEIEANIIQSINNLEDGLNKSYIPIHYPYSRDNLEFNDLATFWNEVNYTDDLTVSENKAYSGIYYPYTISFEPLETSGTFFVYHNHEIICTGNVYTGDTQINLINLPPSYYSYVILLDNKHIAGEFIVSSPRLFYTIPSNENVDSEPLFNVRDLGGMTGANGCKIRYGKLIRGSVPTSSISFENTLNNICNYNQHKGINYLHDTYTSLKLISLLPIDETSDINEVTARFSLTNHYDLIELMANNEENQETYNLRECIKYIVKNIDKNLFYYYCIIGTHRTGVVSSILEGLLGVSASDIEKDYELSTSNTLNCRRSDQATCFNFIRQNYNGSWYKWGVENLDLSFEEIEHFRYILLEGYIPNISTNPVFEEKGVLYSQRSGSIYPVVHPDLSTLWSILPERFGKFPIYETLIPLSMFTSGSSYHLSQENASIYSDILFNPNAIYLDFRWIGNRMSESLLKCYINEFGDLICSPCSSHNFSYLYAKVAVPIDNNYYQNKTGFIFYPSLNRAIQDKLNNYNSIHYIHNNTVLTYASAVEIKPSYLQILATLNEIYYTNLPIQVFRQMYSTNEEMTPGDYSFTTLLLYDFPVLILIASGDYDKLQGLFGIYTTDPSALAVVLNGSQFNSLLDNGIVEIILFNSIL